MSKMNLCIDLGNTRAKLALFETGNKVPHTQENVAHEDIMPVLEGWCGNFEIKNAIISSVLHKNEALENWLRDNISFVLVLNENTKLPIINAYDTPHTLGADRIAMAAGAWSLYPQQSTIVISLGTCITYNIVIHNRYFRGGAISPGMSMRFKAMNEFTDKLPLVNENGDQHLLGYDTATSMRSGVVNGIVSEIEGFIEKYNVEFKQDFNAVLTGGDASFFVPKIKSKIFANPDILMIGLHEILKENVPLF